jgi:hypothetical protein
MLRIFAAAAKNRLLIRFCGQLIRDARLKNETVAISARVWGTRAHGKAQGT